MSETTDTSIETMFETNTLTMTRDGHVAHATLTRPDLLNRVDEEMHDDFRRMLAVVENTAEVRVLLLTSTGKAFSAGGDANWMQEVNADPSRARHMVNEGYLLMTQLLSLRVPLVCAVQGAAMGLGSNIALASDVLVAGPKALFADPHVRMGLVAGDGGTIVWPQSGGMMRAKRHLLTGDPIDAADAYAAGMVTDLVDDTDELVPTALGIAQRIAALPPLAVQGTKKALNRVLLQRAGEVFELSITLELDTMGSRDLMEATAAFLEKRPGVYEGR